MKMEVDLDAINVALIEEFMNKHALTFELALNEIIRSYMLDSFKRSAQAGIPKTVMDYPIAGTQVWYSKGKV